MEYAMNRRQLVMAIAAVGATAGIVPMRSLMAKTSTQDAQTLEFGELKKPLDEWRKLLAPEAFHVLFKEGTEPPGSSALNDEKRDGLFICAACYLPLFTTSAKYESGTGWPSFYQPIAGRVGFKTDFKIIYPRKEYHCARCGGHQGHVFKDGPKPTGLRYCNNGVALKFVAANEPLPDLRA